MSAAITAVAIGGASLIGGMIQSDAANRAAGAQTDAANQATALQGAMYGQTREDQRPWREAGANAINELNQNSGYFQEDFNQDRFKEDPGYAFRMAEGQKALERSAAARGGLNSGGTMKALSRYGQDFASNEYQNAYNRFNGDRDRRFNRLASLAGLGQTANSAIGNAGMNYANNAGNNMMSGANASSAATMANANNWNSAIGTGANTWMNYSMMNRMYPQTQPTPAATGGGYGAAGMSALNTGNIA